MPRESRLYLEDILDCIDWLVESTAVASYAEFTANRMLRQAVERNCEILGEAAKSVPDSVKQALPEIDWKGLARLRDVLAHRYHRLDYLIIWDAIKQELPAMAQQIRTYLAALD